MVKTEDKELKASIKAAVEAIGGFTKAIKPGDKVLLKGNWNSAAPPPASIDLGFLAAVVELLREEAINDLTLGERAGWPWAPTADVLEKMGVDKACRELNLPLVNFDFGPWMDVRLGEGMNWLSKVGFLNPSRITIRSSTCLA